MFPQLVGIEKLKQWKELGLTFLRRNTAQRTTSIEQSGSNKQQLIC
jgi:hypothetical protein